MPTIGEITSGNSYVGNAQIGGANTGAFQIDTRPIQQLAQYTYLYNKSLFDQSQKDADQKIEELAKLTAYDLSNARGKDKDAGITALADLQKFGAEFAAKGTPKTPEEKIKQQIEYQNKIQGAEKIINSINARGIGYTARKNAILASTADAGLKDTQLKQLDEEFDNTDIYTKISAQPNFDLSVPKVGAPIIKKTGVLVETPNGVIDQTLGFFDPKSNLNAAYLEANNLELPVLPPNATALQKQEYEQKLKVKSANSIWQDAAVVYNTALSDPKYKLSNSDPANPVGDIDYNAIEADNPILHNTLQLIDRYNAYAAERKADATAGYYTDKLGNNVKLLQTVKPEDFFIIDKTKALSPAQVVFLEKFATAAPDTKDEKFQYSGDFTKLRIENIQQAAANYRARLEQEGLNKRSEQKITPPVDNGNIIFNVNGAVTGGGVEIKNGTIVDTKTGNIMPINGDFPVPASYFDNSIFTEYNKYAGKQTMTKDANGLMVTNEAINPSRLLENGNNRVVRFKDGIIQGIKTDKGDFASVDQFDYITNQANIKGVKKYQKQVDISGNTGKNNTKVDTNKLVTDVGEQLKKTGTAKLQMPDGTIITSSDGQTWYDSKGKLVQ